MKTAKEITEYLTKEKKEIDDANEHLVYIQQPEGYWSKIEMLKAMRTHFLDFEYMENTGYTLKGIEDALRWILEEEKET